MSRNRSPRTIVSNARVAVDDDLGRALHPVALRVEIEPAAPQRHESPAAAHVGADLAVVTADRPGLDDVAGTLAPHVRQDGHALEHRLVDARAPADSASRIIASTRKLRIMKPSPAASTGPPIPSSRRMPWPHSDRVGDRSRRISSKVEDVRDRGQRQRDRQVVPEPGAEDPLAGRARRRVELGGRLRAQDRARVDEPGDRDRVLARAVRAQARGGDLGRRPDARVEHDVDVGPGQDGVDVRRDGRAEPHVQPARLAEVEALLGGVVDDPAAEREPRPGEARPRRSPGRHGRSPRPRHRSCPSRSIEALQPEYASARPPRAARSADQSVAPVVRSRR